MELVWKDDTGKPLLPSEIHRAEYAFLERAFDSGIPCVILAPMGSGKTTTECGLGGWLQAKMPAKRFAIISDIVDHAEDRLAVLQQYTANDPDYRDLFPEVQLDRSKRGRRTLGKYRLSANPYAKDPTFSAHGVLASGTGNRSDVQLYDDLCTEQNSIARPADRERVKKTFFGGWRNRLHPGGWWTYIGTPYHQDDLTHALLASKSIAHLKIALDPETLDHYTVEEFWPGEEVKEYTLPLWEPVWTKERYEQVRDEMAALGDLSKFYSAYCGLIIDPTKAAFVRKWFERNFVIHVPKHYQLRVLYADPATAQDKAACYYAGVGLGYDTSVEKATVLTSWRVKTGLSERVGIYLDAYEEIHPHYAAIEGKHEGAFGERIEEVALERGIGLRLRRINHDSDKEARIASLVPLLQHEKILVDLERWPYFWKEASYWPMGKMDALDALEGAWAIVKTWLKQRAYIPTKFPVSRQYGRRGMFQARRFEDASPEQGARRRGFKPSHRELADHFFG